MNNHAKFCFLTNSVSNLKIKCFTIPCKVSFHRLKNNVKHLLTEIGPTISPSLGYRISLYEISDHSYNNMSVQTCLYKLTYIFTE